jgi:hypothetical protein
MECNAMKRVIFMFIIVLVFSACQSAPQPEQVEDFSPSQDSSPPQEFPPLPSPPPPPPSEKIPFTLSMREALQKDKLSRVQFYLSGSITLIKEEIQGNIDVESGKIVTVSGQNLQEIYIPMETEGVCASYDERGILNISFENDAVISFALNRNKDRYELMLNVKDGRMVVHYGNIDYGISLSSGEVPYLLVVTEQIKSDAIDRKTVTGRKAAS